MQRISRSIARCGMRVLRPKTLTAFRSFSSMSTGAEYAAFGQKHLSPGISRMTNAVLRKGQGSWVETVDGERILDFSCGIAVTNLGHCHPHVVKAVQKQAGELHHAQVNIVYHEPMLKLIDKLKTVTPKGLDCFFFWNSGAEAIEAAVKLARHATKRQNIIVFQGSFHGRTIGTMSLTTSKYIYRAGYQPLMPGVFVAPFPYKTQLPAALAGSEEARMQYSLQQLDMMLKQQTSPSETAAILLEPILGEGGYVVPPMPFLKELRHLCDKHGMLLIADEIQTGFGRTGTMFAVEQFQTIPDIIVMAKGLASGYPLSAIASRRDLMEKQPPGSQGGTYAGNAVSCAAALATLEVFEQERVLDNVMSMGQHLRTRLQTMSDPNKARKQKLPILEVRGLGLMQAVEFTPNVPAGFATTVCKLCREKGMLLLPTSAFETIRVIPPLNVTKQELDQGIDILQGAIADAAAALPRGTILK